MEKLFKLFRLLPDVIHWYLNEFVFPTHTPHQVLCYVSAGKQFSNAHKMKARRSVLGGVLGGNSRSVVPKSLTRRLILVSP